MRKFKVDLSELAFAFESNFEGTKNYFDLETGEVVAVGDDIRGELEAIYEQMDEEETPGSPTFAELVAQQGLPEWQQQQLLVADAVEAGYGTRFVAVPQVESGEVYGDMEDFIATVSDPHLQELLDVAITGRGAFRRFKDVLFRYPSERERWFAFRDERMEQRMREWLEEYDIEPIAAPPVELWPRVIARVAVPADVEQELLEPWRRQA
jgi:hypothetical protein